jgi:hypothetical protein
MNWISHDGKLSHDKMSSPLELGAWNLDFASMLGSVISILGQIPSSRFQVPRFKARQHTKSRVFLAPSELWNLELGTWNTLDFAASRSKFQTPLGISWPNRRFQVPRTYFQESSKEQSKFQETLELGQIPSFRRSIEAKFPTQGPRWARAESGSLERYFHSTRLELAREILNYKFYGLAPSGTFHYRVRFRSSGGSSSNWKTGMSNTAVD